MAKSRVRALNPNRTFDTFWVLINLSGPRYWKVSRDSIEKSSAPLPNEGPVISFDETSDFRVSYQKSSSVKQATKYFLTEKQEKSRVYQGPKYNLGQGSYTPFYGTPIARLDLFQHKVFPGAYFIDHLLAKQKIKLDEARVIGFKLEEANELGEGFTIIVLYGIHTNGELSEPQVSLNPPELDLILRDYAQTNGIENFDPILFTLDDLCKIPQGIGYPTESMIGTTPVRVLTNMAATAIFGVAGLSYAYSGYLWVSIESAKSEAVAAEKRANQAKQKTENVLLANLGAITERTSINYGKLFEYTTTVYNPTLLVSEANLVRGTGTFQADVSIFKMAKSERDTRPQFPYHQVNGLLTDSPPEGLVRKIIYVNGDSSGYKIQYEFQTLDSPLPGLIGLK